MNAIRDYLDRARSLVADIRLVLGDGVRRLPWLLVLMLVMTALDVLAVIAIAPFLARIVGSAAAVPGVLREITDGWSLRMLGVAVVTSFALKGIATLWVQRRISKVTEGQRAALMCRLLSSYQSRPYQFHLTHNTNELITTVLWYSQAFTTGVLYGALQVAANGLVLMVLALVLAWTDVSAFVVLALGLGSVFVMVAVLLRPVLGRAVQTYTSINARLIQATNQALLGVREIRLLGREAYFRDELALASRKLVDAAVVQNTLAQVPRQVIEVALVGFLVVMVWVMTRGTASMETVVPVLGVFATAGLRLMPATTALLSSWNSLRSNVFAARALAKVIRESEIAEPEAAKACEHEEAFESLSLRDVHYLYSGTDRPAIEGVSLEILKGEAIGIMGRSGAGKSSLADLMLGLLQPSAGQMLVNGSPAERDLRGWQSKTAYIPQSVFLIDDTLRRNVALGLADAEIDEMALRSAIDAAQLSPVVAQLPAGLDTVLGERGVRLSGGQRQRVAIARALYHRRQFLVLDEATSALDVETEQAVVDAINSLAGTITMVVIAHRRSTLSACSRIIHLEQGKIVGAAFCDLEPNPGS